MNSLVTYGSTSGKTVSTPVTKPATVTAPTSTISSGASGTVSTPSGMSSKAKSDRNVTKKNADCIKALSIDIPDAVVDIKVSLADQPIESELSRNGYTRLMSETADVQTVKKGNSKQNTPDSISTFSNKYSIWVWKRNQGTCSGRLKPIIDIILESSGLSTELVISGYTCDPVSINGQWLWTKRAVTTDEEKFAIVELDVTVGNMKKATDEIWNSPGVGWIRVDGNFTKSYFGSIDAFLWYKPYTTRSIDSVYAQPTRSVGGMTEDMWYVKILSSVRTAIRHFVPLEDMKRLANLIMEVTDQVSGTIATKPTSNQGESQRSAKMSDFTALYHTYDTKGKLSHGAFSKLLVDVGIRMARSDVDKCFSYFDVDYSSTVSRLEYANILTLTDYEIDLAVDRIRLKLLAAIPTDIAAASAMLTMPPKLDASVSKPTAGVLGAGTITAKDVSKVGYQKIRESLMLQCIFRAINTNPDSIFSLDELMDLASKVEVFLTEDEARKALHMMDLDGDDRVEEGDFIEFMRKDSCSVLKKAHRVKDAAALFRRWLVRSKVDSSVQPSKNKAPASMNMWVELKHQYNQATRQKFPGFLNFHSVLISVSKLSVHLSVSEAKELAYIISPEKSGRIYEADLHAFMDRSCRSFGELFALLERQLLGSLFHAYKAHFDAIQMNGQVDKELEKNYKSRVQAIKDAIDKAETTAQSSGTSADGGRTGIGTKKKQSADYIPVTLIKAGFELFWKDMDVATKIKFPILEEWVCLCMLADADVVESDVYGVRVNALIDGLCHYAVKVAHEMKDRKGEKGTLDLASKEFIRQINFEAKLAGKDMQIHPLDNKLDYKYVFELFDLNGDGFISMEELKKAVQRYKLMSDLADAQVPQLLALIDKNKKGVVTLEDFIAFVKGGDNKGTADSKASGDIQIPIVDSKWEEEFDKDDIEAMWSNVPPVPISKNGDCDWLLWQLYRQACRADPSDPEGVVTEMQCACDQMRTSYRAAAPGTQSNPTALSASIVHTVSVRELWALIVDMRLQGNMSREQFVKSTKYLAIGGDGKDDDRVDYETLGKLVIRMGRAFNAIVQERNKQDEEKFPSLLADLKLYFQELSKEKTQGTTPNSAASLTRYEKLFRRLDSDGDGMLSPKEFRLGLRALQFNQEKEWNIRMIRRFFDLCDRNKDGLLSVAYFNNYVLGQPNMPEGFRYEQIDEEKESFYDRMSDLELQDNQGDDSLFGSTAGGSRRKKAVSDDELMRIVYEVLEDIVPMESDGSSHKEAILNSVKRFFQRADPDFKGTVSEERFQAFLRRSSLQDRLTATQLKRLEAKVRATHNGMRKAVVYDYEKFCQLLSLAAVKSTSIGKIQAEKVFARFLEAVVNSSSNGRSFLFLCSLVDRKMSGQLSKEEFLHTAKMMDCELSNEELEALLNHLPGDVCKVTRSKSGVDTYTIYYRLVDAFLSQQSQSHATLSASQHLPSLRYGMHPNPQQSMMTATPGLFNTYDAGFANSPWSHPSSNNNSGKQLFDRLKVAIEEKSKSWGTNFSLKKQFEVFDSEKKGKISLRTLQGTLQEMGVLLTQSEVQIVNAQFGQPEDDRVNYEAFCKGLDSFMGTAAPKPAEQKASSKPAEQPVITELPVTLVAQSQALPGFNVYVTQRVLQRVKELRREGRDPRDIFEANDLDRTGMVTVNQFKQIVSKLQLLQSEVQLSKAVEDFLSLSNKNMVVYDDFCNFLEAAAEENRNARAVDGSGFDGVALRQSRSLRGNNNLFGGGDADGFGDPYNRTTFSARSQQYPIELEEGSDYAPGFNSVQRRTLSPPKLTDSFNQSFRQQRWNSGTSNMNTPSRYLNNSGYAESIAEFSPRRSVSIPPISPAKAGSKMWGNRTPLSKKGHALKVDSNKWCCTVCMYVENPKDAQNCIVCDSPNYNANKDYQVREQCQNCTMLNGQFAEECEMCGEPLLAARGH